MCLSNECDMRWSSSAISVTTHASKQTHHCHDTIIMCTWWDSRCLQLQHCNYIMYQLFAASLCHVHMYVWYGRRLQFMQLSMHRSWCDCYRSSFHDACTYAKAIALPFISMLITRVCAIATRISHSCIAHDAAEWYATCDACNLHSTPMTTRVNASHIICN